MVTPVSGIPEHKKEKDQFEISCLHIACMGRFADNKVAIYAIVLIGCHKDGSNTNRHVRGTAKVRRLGGKLREHNRGDMKIFKEEKQIMWVRE